METALRLIFIILLIAILAMQIFFLIEKQLCPQEAELPLSKPGLEKPDTLSTVLPKPEKAIPQAEEPVKVIADPDNATEPITRESSPQEPEKVVYAVNASECISCGLCLRVCPEDAIYWENGVAKIDETKCTGCGICADGNGRNFRGCPVEAISQKNVRVDL
ncbi:MAG: 4Fe-4S binding protein [Candidatus Cloacimonetes bacterium]|nr:4Fe-4S binding protein [Candidatus Cloacimonadota bacterium]